MPVLVKCPNSHKINVPDKFIGKKVKCPKCEAEFVVAAGEAPSAVTPAPVTTKPQQPASPTKTQSGSQPSKTQPSNAVVPASKPIMASPVVSEPTAPFDPFSSALPEPTADPFADPFGNAPTDPFGNTASDPFADPFAQSASPAADPWTTQGGYNASYSGSGMQYASPATNVSAASSSESTDGSPQPLIRTIMYVVGGCFGIFAFVMVLFVVISLVGISKPSKSVASSGPKDGNPSRPAPEPPVLPAEPVSNNSNNLASEKAPDATSSSKQDIEDMSDEDKKKINVFGYDSEKRARLVEFLAKNNVNKLKGNVNAMLVAGKLMKAAKTLKISPDENRVIAFPKDTKFEQHFNDDTLMNVVEIEKLPDVFLPLIKKYEKGEANREEKELAFFVLAAFYLTELK